jgi:hypothetical protein
MFTFDTPRYLLVPSARHPINPGHFIDVRPRVTAGLRVGRGLRVSAGLQLSTGLQVTASEYWHGVSTLGT